MSKKLKTKEDFIKLTRKLMRASPDIVGGTIDDFHNNKIKKINEEIKRAKTIKRIEKF